MRQAAFGQRVRTTFTFDKSEWSAENLREIEISSLVGVLNSSPPKKDFPG